jgi:hypothetical protein
VCKELLVKMLVRSLHMAFDAMFKNNASRPTEHGQLSNIAYVD